MQELFTDLQPSLRQVGDQERILARLALRTARPRDLARMRHAFQQLPDIRALLQDVDTRTQQLLSQVGQFDELRELLERAVIESPPVLVRDGGVIAPVQQRAGRVARTRRRRQRLPRPAGNPRA